MKAKTIEGDNTIAIIVFLLGCLGLISVIALDKLYWGTSVFDEGWPKFSINHLIRSIIIIISILAICLSLINRSRPKLTLDVSNRGSLEQLSVFGTLSLSIIFLFLFIFEPSIFSTLSVEDGPIEWGSALLLFGSSIIFAISYSKSRNLLNIPKVNRLSLALLFLVFFVIAMEEISWFQRVVEIEILQGFENNEQGEINIHNFATNDFENLYYFGAFLFLVVFPYFRFLFPYLSHNNYLRIFVARPFIGILGSISCAYNFDMWNIIFIQITFWGSVVILFVFATLSSNRNEKYLILFVIFLIATTQALFLIKGENFVYLWEITEYKELLIPLVFFIYSLDVFSKINRVCLAEKANTPNINPHQATRRDLYL